MNHRSTLEKHLVGLHVDALEANEVSFLCSERRLILGSPLLPLLAWRSDVRSGPERLKVGDVRFDSMDALVWCLSFFLSP